MNKLPKLPFEICEIIFEYSFRNRTLTILFENKYFIRINNNMYGYNDIYSLTRFLYKEIYFT